MQPASGSATACRAARPCKLGCDGSPICEFNLPGRANGCHHRCRTFRGPRPRPAQPGAVARLALCRGAGPVRAGAGRRRDAGLPNPACRSPNGSRSTASSRRSTTPNGRRNSQRYQQIPQYAELNKGMSIEAFKTIFWWEWAHRILARSVGVVFALPLLFFWATRRIEHGLGPKLVGILLLGGLQGAIGWWMVASGLVDRVSVSQYRLATHLTLAALIFTATMVVARGLAPHSETAADRSTQRLAGHPGAAGADPDLSRRAGRRARRRPELQHMAADGRQGRPGRPASARAGMAQLLREPEDGAVRPSARRLHALRRWRSGT